MGKAWKDIFLGAPNLKQGIFHSSWFSVEGTLFLHSRYAVARREREREKERKKEKEGEKKKSMKRKRRGEERRKQIRSERKMLGNLMVLM